MRGGGETDAEKGACVAGRVKSPAGASKNTRRQFAFGSSWVVYAFDWKKILKYCFSSPEVLILHFLKSFVRLFDSNV